MIDLSQLGWNGYFHEQLTAEESQAATVARIVEPLRGLARATCRRGEIWAENADRSDKAGVAVGDWVVGRLRSLGQGEARLSVDRILERKNKLSRAAPGGKNYEQILCANVDIAFLVLAMNQTMNLAGLERSLELVKESGVSPVIVLTKADLCDNYDSVREPIRQVCGDCPIHIVSVSRGEGVDPVHDYFSAGKTVVLLGASGAGKSSLVNHLLDTDIQRVGEVRESDQKGRHTTTGRRLHLRPRGGMVIDSPGIREVQKWEPPQEAVTEKKKKSKGGGKPFPRPRRNWESED